ncbi:MAG: 3-hydroxyacyl-CoA dehydrogenase NAD-binding domain-containing protein [Gammaproteobacteria bacterium]
METNKTFQHWVLEKDQKGIVWLWFDQANASVNSLGHETLGELKDIIDTLSGNDNVKGLVIGSRKSSSFIAGADVKEFQGLKDEKEAELLIRKGQLILQQLESLPIPTVAMISGICLGGGLELALACDYRITDTENKTRLGLPEVKLGIHPGWGGTIRLPRLIGPFKAFDLILSGRTIDTRAAKRMRIIDAAVPKRQLTSAAEYFVLNEPDGTYPGNLNTLMNTKVARIVIAEILKRYLKLKAKEEHYPAPFAALTQWKKYGVRGEHAYVREARSVAKLLFTETSYHLQRCFHLQNTLKGLSRDTTFNPKRVHVIGSGVMGGDIAAWCAMKGLTVTLQDQKIEYIAPAIKRANALFKKRLKLAHLIQAANDRLIPDIEGLGISRADVIIEAVVEKLDVKHEVFKNIVAKAKPEAVLATNTSSFPLSEIASVLPEPSRLVGIHFFNPVEKMQLVEVVEGVSGSKEVQNKLICFVRELDKLPLPVKSSPGFLVNRILMPYLVEAVLLYEEGVSVATIDKAATDFGMPMGPCELADVVGLDVCLAVAESLSKHYGIAVPSTIKEKIEANHLGKKTGQGFYHYLNGKRMPQYNKASSKEVARVRDRLILRLLNEAGACLREGIVTNEDFLDAGMVFGTGFAPFRGGPMHYIEKHAGKAKICEQLKEHAAEYGKRFQPDEYFTGVPKDETKKNDQEQEINADEKESVKFS